MHDIKILVGKNGDRVSLLILEGELKSGRVEGELLGGKVDEEVIVELAVEELDIFLVNKYDFHL